MIVMVGTGHVFRIAETLSFIIKNIWPDAVLVELDENRLSALTSTVPTSGVKATNSSDLPKSYLRSAKYQDKLSSKNDTQTGGELLAAIQTAKLIGSQIVCIDRDAQMVMREMEDEMSAWEKVRYSWSAHTDNFFGLRKLNKVQNDFFTNEEAYLNHMRKKYPTFVRKLIDERNDFMAARIKEEASKYESVVIVVGDAHVEGICKMIPELDIRKIRLIDLLDQERLEKVKDAVWNSTLDEVNE